jgi:hypothetical protein
MPNAYLHLAGTRDSLYGAFWTINTQVMFASVATGVIKANFNVTTTPTYFATKKITFSSDSTLALIESDNFNPLYIMNISSNSLYRTIPVDVGIIHSAHFINSTDQYVIVFGTNATVLVDIIDSLQYSLPVISGTDFTTDHANNIFVCMNNQIQQSSISLAYVTNSTNTTNATNTSNSTNTTNATSNTTTNNTNTTNNNAIDNTDTI